MNSLQDKKLLFTKNLVIAAACELLNELDINELSFKKVAEHAGMSERTMFRHFRTRDEFLNALTASLHEQLALPDIPKKVSALLDYIDRLYHQLDDQPRKVLVLLDAELLPRVIASTAKKRLKELTQLLTDSYPNSSKDEIIKTAANLRYVMSASSWRYYRVYFEFDLDTSIECAKMLIKQSLQHLQESAS